MNKVYAIRQAPFALRVVQRKEGKAAIVYRRKADANGRDRLRRIAALSPLAFTAAIPLLREAVKQSSAVDLHSSLGSKQSEILSLTNGAFYPLDVDWGCRVACFALIAAGLRNGERLLNAVNHLRRADPNEAAWWLGLLTRDNNIRALRALRILTEAVE